MDNEFATIEIRVQGQADVDQMTRSLGAGDEALKKITSTAKVTTLDVQHATVAAASTTRNYGQAILSSSFALQDFTSAQGDFLRGLGAVQNNLPIIIAQLGVSGGVAGAISIAAVAIGTFANNWSGIVRQFSATRPFKDIAGDVEGMKEELKKAETELGKLATAERLTVDEAAKYEGLRARTLELEKKITAEAERQANIKKLMELKEPVQAAAEKERADILQESFGDPEQKALIRSVQAAMPRDQKKKLEATYKKALEEVAKQIESDPLDLTGQLPRLQANADALGKQIRDAEKKIQDDAIDLVTKAVIGGKLPEFRKIEEMIKAQAGAFNEAATRAFEAASPESLRGRKELAAKLEAEGEKRKEDQKKQDAIDEATRHPKPFRVTDSGLSTYFLDPRARGAGGGGGLVGGGGGGLGVGPGVGGAAEFFAPGGDLTGRIGAPAGMGKGAPGRTSRAARFDRAKVKKEAAERKQRVKMVKRLLAREGAKAQRTAGGRMVMPPEMRIQAPAQLEAVDGAMQQIVRNQAMLANQLRAVGKRAQTTMGMAQQLGQLATPQGEPALNYGSYP